MLKFGIIGAGMIAQHGHDGLMASGEAECVSICDSNEKRGVNFVLAVRTILDAINKSAKEGREVRL